MTASTDDRIRLLVFLVLLGTVAAGVGAAQIAAGSSGDGTIYGTVTDGETGEELDGVQVELYEGDSVDPDANDPNETAVTGTDGRYTFADLAENEDYTVAVVDGDYEDETTTVNDLTDETEAGVELTPKNGSITGIVTDDEGGPLDGVDVILEDDGGTQVDSTTTDSDGAYTFDEVERGAYTVEASDPDYEDAETTVTVDLNEDVENVDFELTPHEGSINGTVEDDVTGDPLEGMEVMLSEEDTEVDSTTTDDDGDYEFTNVAAGEYTVEVVDPDGDYVTEEVEVVDVDVNEDVDDVDFALEWGETTITGTVENGVSGDDLEAADVTLEDDDGTEIDSVTTDAAGAFEFPGLDSGEYTVVVDAGEYHKTAENVALDVNELVDLDVELDPVDGSIDGVVLDDAGGDPLEGITVNRYAGDDTAGDPDDTTSTDADGEYAFPAVTASTEYTIEVADANYVDDFETVEVDPDEDVRVDFDLLVDPLPEITTEEVDPESVEIEQDVYQSPAGDLVTIDVSVDDVDDAYLLLGADTLDDESGVTDFMDVLYLPGDATFVVNTRLVGTDSPTEEVYIPVDGTVESYLHGDGGASRTEFHDVEFAVDGVDSLAEFHDEVGVSLLSRPIQPDRLRMVAGYDGTVVVRDDGVPDHAVPLDRSNLLLTEPAVGEVNTYVLPKGNANRVEFDDDDDEPTEIDDIGALLGAATERDTVAEGDRILIEVEATGMWGAMRAGADEPKFVADGGDAEAPIHPGTIDWLAERHEGVLIEATRTDERPNVPEQELDFGSANPADVHILPDVITGTPDGPQVERFYLVVDTRSPAGFEDAFSGGEEFTFEFGYESPPGERYSYQSFDHSAGELPAPFSPDNDPGPDGVEHFPYFAADETSELRTVSYAIEEPDVEYDRTSPDDEPIVVADTDTISGETNLAPGSYVTIQLVSNDRNPPSTVTVENVAIGEDGTFSVTEDFSELDVGERVEIEFYRYEELLDKRATRIVDDIDEPSAFEITDVSEEPAVTQGERLEAISATVVNTGGVADRQTVEFELDGEIVRESTVRLDAGEETTLALDDEFVVLPPGEYSFAVRTDDDERAGQLIVEAPDEVPPPPEDDEPEASPAEDDADDGEQDEESGEGLGEPLSIAPGIRGRDVVGGAAIVGALHVLGHWI